MTYLPPVNGGRINVTVGGNSTSAGAGYILASTGTVTLAGGNNVTLSQNGNAITISAGAGGAGTGNIYALGNTTGQSSSSSYDLRTLSVDGGGMVSVGWSNSSLRISATQSNQSQGFTAGTTNGANTTLTSTGTFDARSVYLNAHGAVSAGFSASSLVVSAPATSSMLGTGIVNISSNGSTISFGAPAFSAGISNIGNTSNTSGVQTGQVVFAGGNNITLSQTHDNGSATITISAGAGGAGLSAGVSDIGNTLNNSGLVTGRLVLAGGNNIVLSGSTNGGSATYTISASSQSNQSQGITLGTTNGGNTSLTSTGTFDARSVYLNAHGALSGGFSSSSIFLSAPVTSSLSATGAVSISTNGSTISIGAPGETIQTKALGKELYYSTNNTSLGQNSLFFFPSAIEGSVSGSVIKIPVNVTFSSSAVGAHTRGYTARLGVYTRHSTNSTILTQHYSTSYTAGFYMSSSRTISLSIITGLGNSTSYNSTTMSDNLSALSSVLHGSRELMIGFASHVTPGEYWFAFAHSTSSAGAAGNIFNLSFPVFVTSTSANNALGVSANTTQGMFRHLGLGSYSATTGAMPASVSMTQINPLSYFPHMYIQNATS
jgi:hypothetical protein